MIDLGGLYQRHDDEVSMMKTRSLIVVPPITYIARSIPLFSVSWDENCQYGANLSLLRDGP
jgi:hypothetical protein